VLSTVALQDAMRLLGGGNRRAAAFGVVGLAASAALVIIGGIGVVVAGLIG
jgi:hypothetical protein